MTIYGWDASHHDWSRGAMDISAAVHDGMRFMTHKLGEGHSFVDEKYDDFRRRATAAEVPLIGAYYINHPGDQVAQADRFLALLDARAPGWRDGAFVLQVDAEKFDYMTRAPNLTEIQAFCGRLVSRTGGRYTPAVYAPRWLYGDGLTGLGYPLWASNYGANPVAHYRAAYPGDGSTRWAAYSGQTPAILQYGSRTRIGSQNTCDANAFRGTAAQLRALVHPPSKEDDMPLTAAEIDAIADKVWKKRLNDDNAWPTAAVALTNLWQELSGVPGQFADWQHTKDIVAIKSALASLAAKDWTDEPAIVAGVLAQLTPQRIAAAIPPELAEQLIEALGQKMIS